MKVSDFEVGKKYVNDSVWVREDSTYITLLSDGTYTVTNKYGEATTWTDQVDSAYADDWVEL